MTLPESEKKPEKKERPLSKVIIRRLPPTMDQETFLTQVSPIPDYNYIYTVKGDFSLGEFAFSRVYINFINPDDIFSFKERFDNYVFLDNKGHEYPAVVEFASFQKIPKKRGKIRMDPKCGTIETDPIYIDFVESLNKPQELDEKPEYTLQLTNENKNDVTTPLLEYIKNKRAQRMRIREVRREERKRREFDRKKDKYEDRRKPNEEKSPLKSDAIKSQFVKPSSTKNEKNEVETNAENKVEGKLEKTEKLYEKSSSSYYKNKERKFDERRKDIKPRFPRKEYSENRDYKRSDDYKDKDYKTKYDDYKKDVTVKPYTKKVKKYSEKREERKMEVQKAEQKKIDQAKGVKTDIDESKLVESKNTEVTDVSVKANTEVSEQTNDGESQKRIRNKDRPTIAIYRPGMLSKRKQNDGEAKEEKAEMRNDEKSEARN